VNWQIVIACLEKVGDLGIYKFFRLTNLNRSPTFFVNLQIPIDSKEKVGDLSLYTDDPFRGKAFPQKSISFQIILNWECFALTSQRRDKLLVKAQRV
jgi:hypothetical protein